MIKQFTSANELHFYINDLKSSGKKVGFVPTMGALHDGHMSLISTAMIHNDVVVCSIFVNPKQFNNPDDLEKYPRTVDEDLKLLDQHNCQIVFVPTVNEIYPEEVNKVYDFGPLATQMEGEHRPGHFNGMAIVVKRLFDIVSPNRAYFGEKDFQQLVIVRKLVEIEQMSVEVIGCPISREKSGLAMSSRNKLLSERQKNDASLIFKELTEVSYQFTTNLEKMNEVLAASIARLNMIQDFEVEYLSLVDINTLLAYKEEIIKGSPHLFIAVKVGKVRLIDNLPIIV